MPLGFSPVGLLLLVVISFAICVTVNTLAMEAAVLFTPAFLFVLPKLVPAFPDLSPQGAIGLALFVEFFGYSSSVSAYWFREQIDFAAAKRILKYTVPVAIVARIGSLFIDSDALMLAFGGLLLALSVVLWGEHRNGTAPIAHLEQMLFGSVGETEAHPEYDPQTRMLADGGTPELVLDNLDRGMMVVGGALAGLVGIAIGELTQTTLAVRKRLPVSLSTGTSALVLHVTILSALATNLAIVGLDPSFLPTDGFSVPFGVGAILAPVVVVGGQTGAYINNRLSEETAFRILVAAYFLIGLFVFARTLLLTGGAH